MLTRPNRSTRTHNALDLCGIASLNLPQKTITFWSGELGVRLNGEKMRTLVALFIIGFSVNAFADLADKLDDLVGYVIVDSKTIKGWYDDDESEEGAFKGCKHGRVIAFTDNTGLTCAEYGYQYAYRPTVVILAKEISYQGKSFYDYKMVVGDDVYDMRR